MPNRRHILLGAVAMATAALAAAKGGAQSPPLVSAASDLQFALDEVAAAFTAASGKPVKIAYGSSGNLARQIRQGAPVDVFLSADERYVADLARDGFTQGEAVLYAVGRLALFVPKSSPLRPDGGLDDLAAALADGRLQKFAIANPEHAPYGRAAEQALRRKGLWPAIQPKLVLGENVSQAAQFAASASTQGGLIAYSLTLSPRLAALGRYALVPAEWHAPLRQSMALTRNAGAAAQEFFAFMQTPQARAILAQYGFAVPNEQ